MRNLKGFCKLLQNLLQTISWEDDIMFLCRLAFEKQVINVGINIFVGTYLSV